MPKRTDIKSILIIGAGPIVIGQACEFDYSGAQACKALRAEGYRVVLVNSNPATIMTDPNMADATYIEPVTWQMVGRRSKEISIRIALGARRGEVMRMVAGQSMLLVAIGSGVGLVTGVFASRALATGSDTAPMIVVVSAILAIAAAPASYFPARAASRIEPRMALKSD